MSSGRSLLVTFPHLVEDHPAKESQSLTVDLGEGLLRGEISGDQLSCRSQLRTVSGVVRGQF